MDYDYNQGKEGENSKKCDSNESFNNQKEIKLGIVTPEKALEAPVSSEEGVTNLCSRLTEVDIDSGSSEYISAANFIYASGDDENKDFPATRTEGQVQVHIGEGIPVEGQTNKLPLPMASNGNAPVTAAGDIWPDLNNSFVFIRTRLLPMGKPDPKTPTPRAPRGGLFLHQPVFEAPEGRDFGRSLRVPRSPSSYSCPSTGTATRRDYTIRSLLEQSSSQTLMDWPPRMMNQSDDDYFEELLLSLQRTGNVTAAHISALATLPGLKDSADSFMSSNYPARMNEPWLRPLRPDISQPPKKDFSAEQPIKVKFSRSYEMRSSPGRIPPQRLQKWDTDTEDRIPIFKVHQRKLSTEEAERMRAAAGKQKVFPEELIRDSEKSDQLAASLKSSNEKEHPVVTAEDLDLKLECIPEKSCEAEPENVQVAPINNTSPKVEQATVSEDSGIEGKEVEDNSAQNENETNEPSRFQQITDCLLCRKRRHAVVPESC